MTRSLAMACCISLAAMLPLGSAAAEDGSLEVVSVFDAAAQELPEGLTIGAEGEMLVTMGYPFFWEEPADGWVKRIAADGATETLVTFEGSLAPAGIVTNGEGAVYFAYPNPAAPDIRGVYRLHGDGTPERLPGTEEMLIANGLAFDGRGSLLAGDSATGTIWRIPLDGSSAAEPWTSDADLLGGCGPADVGVNGMAIGEDVVYAANTSRGLLVSIPMEADGSAGPARVVAGDATNECEPDALFGMDGIALDVEGSVYALLVLQDQLVRIDPTDGSAETLLTAADGLHNPASLAFGTQDGDRQSLYIANYAVLPPGSEASLGPAVLRYDVGVEGLPLL